MPYVLHDSGFFVAGGNKQIIVKMAWLSCLLLACNLIWYALTLAASRETSPIRTASEVDYNAGGSGVAKAYAKTLSSTVSRRKGLGFVANAIMRGPRRTSRPLPHSQDPSREGSPVSAVSGNAPYTYGAASTAGSVTNKRRKWR